MMNESSQWSNLLGAIVANVNNVLLLLIFIARIRKMPRVEYWLGLIFILSFIPLLYLLIDAFETQRPLLYFIQICLMLTFLLVEFLLDYMLKVDFRHTQLMVVPYVMLFFASTGGMIGIASHASTLWMMVTVTSFLAMAITCFIMHAITGE